MMESIEKLRESLKDCTSEAGVEPNRFDTYWITARACDMLIDEIEAEIESRYMELPVDADGVPIHVGDRLTNINKPSDEYIVAGVNGEKLFVYGGHAFICASQCRHVKPRTIENVLADFADELHSDRTDGMANRVERLTAKYAAEIRELMEVGK